MMMGDQTVMNDKCLFSLNAAEDLPHHLARMVLSISWLILVWRICIWELSQHSLLFSQLRTLLGPQNCDSTLCEAMSSTSETRKTEEQDCYSTKYGLLIDHIALFINVLTMKNWCQNASLNRCEEQGSKLYLYEKDLSEMWQGHNSISNLPHLPTLYRMQADRPNFLTNTEGRNFDLSACLVLKEGGIIFLPAYSTEGRWINLSTCLVPKEYGLIFLPA